MQTTVINFVGGPGAGKSTTAAGLFYALKKNRVSCEFVGEYAKDVTWEGNHALLENQLHIFAEQYRRQERLIGKVRYVVTDSSLLLSCVYHSYKHHDRSYVEQAKAFFLASFRQFDNDVYVVRHGVREYVRSGRTQTKQEAEEIHGRVLTLLDEHSIPYSEIDPEDKGVAQVLRNIGIAEVD